MNNFHVQFIYSHLTILLLNVNGHV